MPPPRTLLLMVLSSLASACVLGSEPDPGCREDHPQDCGPGWSCRGGVCVRPTTPLSPPQDASADPDAGAGDAARDVVAENVSDAEADGG